MEDGEKYLSVSMSIAKALELGEKAKIELEKGQKYVYFALFKNVNDNPEAPIYKNDNVAVWEKTKTSEVKKEDG